MKTPSRLEFSFLALLVLAGPSIAHEDPAEPIHRLTHQIEAEPGNALLYWERGELLRQEGKTEAARADLERALALDPQLTRIRLALALIDLEQHVPGEALKQVNLLLEEESEFGPALLARSRALAAIGNLEEALHEMDRAIEHLKRVVPGHYIERANLARDLGYIEEAIRGLDAGIERFGNLPTLQLRAVELEISLGRYDAGLARIESLLPVYSRKETLHVRRGDILEAAGRTLEAQAAYTEALEAIAALPPHLREAPATRELAERVRQSLSLE